MAENGDAMVALLACTPSRTGATRQGWVPLVLRVQPMIKSAQASVTKTNGFRLNLPLFEQKTSAGETWQRTPAHQVEVEMKNRLTGVQTGIQQQPIPALADLVLLRQTAGHNHQPTEQRSILLADAVERSNVTVWNDQQVNWRSRMVIAKCRYEIILIDDIRVNCSIDDLAKNTVFNHFSCIRIIPDPLLSGQWLGDSAGISPVRLLQTIS